MKKSIKWVIIVVASILLVVALCFLGYFIYMKNAYLSKEEIKDIVIKDTELNKDKISFKEIDLELDGETKKYEVEFYYNRVEYTYIVNAKTGDIIYSDYIKNTDNDINTNGTPSETPSNYITPEEAKSIALTDAGLTNNEVVFTDIDIDKEGTITVYEVDFYNGNLEYEYKIDVINKTIIRKNKEPSD